MKPLLLAALTALSFAAPMDASAQDGGLIGEIREMRADIEALRGENERLRGDLAALRERVEEGWSLSFHKCDGKRYHCTQRMCKSLCEARGERIATALEVLGWSMAHRADHCAFAWMTDVDAGKNGIRQRLVRLYPMYDNPESKSCHRTNDETVLTGDTRHYTWETAKKKNKDGKEVDVLANCACTDKPF